MYICVYVCVYAYVCVCVFLLFVGWIGMCRIKSVLCVVKSS